MAGYADLIALREDEVIVRRVTVAIQAAVHGILAAGGSAAPDLHLAKTMVDDPRKAAERLFLQVVTSTTILGKLANPASITDADLTTSAAEVLAGLARAA